VCPGCHGAHLDESTRVLALVQVDVKLTVVLLKLECVRDHQGSC
jgi:hypothetical protein